MKFEHFKVIGTEYFSNNVTDELVAYKSSEMEGLYGAMWALGWGDMFPTIALESKPKGPEIYFVEGDSYEEFLSGGGYEPPTESYPEGEHGLSVTWEMNENEPHTFGFENESTADGVFGIFSQTEQYSVTKE